MFESCRNCGQPRKKGMSVCDCGYDYEAQASEIPAGSMPDDYTHTQNINALPTVGIIMILVGSTLMLFAYFGYDVSVETKNMMGEPIILVERIVNLQLLQNQLMIFQGSCTIILMGCLIACTGWLLSQNV